MELASTEKVENRPSIKPFVCSTFQDFTEEREYLSNVVFPKLDEIHKIRGTNFLPVDLYWNKSNYLKQKLTDNRVILLCLDSITRCAPYFICLIGERYGVHLTPTPVHNEEQKELAEWMSINLETAASFGYKWVTDEECRYACDVITCCSKVGNSRRVTRHTPVQDQGRTGAHEKYVQGKTGYFLFISAPVQDWDTLRSRYGANGLFSIVFSPGPRLGQEESRA